MKEDVQEGNETTGNFPGRPIALTIAGFDPSGGAGVTADLKVFAAHHIYGMACITALTIQSTMGVRRVENVSGGTIRETLACLREDVGSAGVKIGMLGTAEAVGEIAGFLSEAGIDRKKIILDPIIHSSSGRELLTPDGLARLKSELLPQVGWVTPNLDELAALTGTGSASRESIPEATASLQGKNPSLGIIVTGGHLDRPDDFLLLPDGTGHWLEGKRVETRSTHGTGCAFSSALLSRLILGDNPEKAAAGAKEYVTAALKAAYPVGQGRGPMHHLFGIDSSL
jgi:hydroxymethylpyrimidine/phosphomethylpyrimidine kinase